MTNLPPGHLLPVAHLGQHGKCCCEVVSFASGENFLCVQYGCPLHCPAPPWPVLNAVDYSMSMSSRRKESGGFTLCAVDHYDPSRTYKVQVGGELAKRWIGAVREYRMGELQALLEGYLAGKGEI